MSRMMRQAHARRDMIMRHFVRRSLYAAVAASVVALALTACETATTTSSVDRTTVSYPDGKYKLYGDGSVTPYYWVWIPNGMTAPVTPPAPPPIPARGVVVTQPGVVVAQPGAFVTQPGAIVTQPGAIVTQPGAVVTQPGAVVTQPGAVVTQPVVMAQAGRYQLYGDGVNAPYYWAWIPSGATPPPPPPLPLR